MDPNEALKEIRELCLTDEPSPDDAARLVELWRALDGWMSSGGFTPQAWQRGPREPHPGL